jgi:hypothetical protein
MYNKQVLVGWLSFALGGFWVLRDNIYELCVCVVFTVIMAMLLAGFCDLVGWYCIYTCLAVFGGVMVIVLAIGPKVGGFKPRREWWIFKGGKNSFHDFFRREYEAVSPVSYDLWHVKDP